MSAQQTNPQSDEDQQQSINAAGPSFLEQFQPSNDFKLGFLGQTSLPTTLTSSELVGIQALGAMTNNVDFNEKIAIYQHPLFPLLRVMFEKCEAATKSIDQADTLIFENEIKTYVSEMTKGNKPFFTDDAEVDSLMLKTLQVLAIHLLELGKVHELCKDFCTRYISCLKGKLNSENIMKTLDIHNTPPQSPTNEMKQDIQNNNNQSNDINMKDAFRTQSNIDTSVFQTPTLIPAIRRSSTSTLESSSKETFPSNRSASIDDTSFVGGSLNSFSVEQLTSGFLSKKNKGGKRGTLPKKATNVLKAWLFQHLVHPYPTEDEKKQLAEQTNLSILQVNNWFINARRRIIQPMLDSSSTVLKNNKKSKQPRNAAQKDWVNTIEGYNAACRVGDATSALNSIGTNQQQLQQPVRLMMGSAVQGPPTMLLNLGGDTATHPMLLNQPVQFLQVNQAIAQAEYLPMQVTNTPPVVTSVPPLASIPHPLNLKKEVE